MEFMSLIEVEPFVSTVEVRFAQEKLDGYYIEIYRGETIQVYTKSRTNDLWPKLGQIEAISRQITALPPNTHIKAELWARGVQASSIPTLINDYDQRLVVSPFEMPLYNGRDSSGWTIEEVNEKLTGFILPKTIRFVEENKDARMLSENEADEWLKSAREMKIEGWVLKDRHCGNYFKLKPERTVDAIITGISICKKGQFTGGIKALQVSLLKAGQKVIIADVGSGLSKELRMMSNPQLLIGKVVEVKYQDIAAKGRLKFPVFIRLRDDEKSAKQCTYEQLAA